MDFVGLPVLLLLLLLHRLLLLPLRSGQCVKDMQPGKENRYQFTRHRHTPYGWFSCAVAMHLLNLRVNQMALAVNENSKKGSLEIHCDI